MPGIRLNAVAPAVRGLLLTLILVLFSTMAAPTSPTTSNPTPSTTTRKKITDMVFWPLFFIAVMIGISLIWGCPPFTTLGVAIDWFRTAYRTFVGALSRFRLGSLFRMIADAIVGPYDATAPSPTVGRGTSPSSRITSPTVGGSTSPPTQTTSPRSLEQAENQVPGGITATHYCASAAEIHHQQAYPPSA